MIKKRRQSSLVLSSEILLIPSENGYFNRKPASLAHGAPDGNPPAVRFDDVLDDAQTDADALGFAPQLRPAPVEALEDSLLFLRRDAVAMIFDP